ncbi:unnamed protein product [Orchesella dallaii]|uniref:RNA-directed DNA polymerase from mobile element jockey n=1 Tax=Orchesella dallaii TaxID=48710 RepID=A0ABP1Q2J5_9HEXA
MTCSVCNKVGRKNQQSLPCTSCKRSYHRSCIQMPPDKYKEYSTNPTWSCSYCQTATKPTCCICKKANRYITILCSICQLHYHKVCLKKHYPNHISEEMKWECPSCTILDEIEVSQCSFDEQPIIQKLHGISIGHLNVRDILSANKKDDIASIINNVNFHIFGITETWLYSEIPDEELYIPGYKIIRSDRPTVKNYKQRGGGLLLYVHEQYEIQRYTTQLKTNVEIVHIHISKEHLPKIHIILAYKPPTVSTKQFCQDLSQQMDLTKHSETYIFGDFNINLLNRDTNCREFLQFMNDNNIQHLIKTPTRTTESTMTLIDNIITNKPNLNIACGVVTCTISDHDLIYTVRKKPRNIRSKVKTVTTRTFKNTDFNKLREMIKTAPWWILKYCNSASEKYNIYEKTLTHILNIHAPLKTFRVKASKKPWMNTKFEYASRKVNKMKRKCKQSHDPDEWTRFKHSRNQATHLKLKLKSEAIKKLCSESTNKSKDMWKVLNTEVGRIKQDSALPTFIHNSTTITDETEKLNLLCEHFTQNSDNISTTISEPTEDSSTSLSNDKLLSELKVTTDEVFNSIKLLDSQKPSGTDNIPAKVLISCAEEVAPYLANIINQILKDGEFPDVLKIALVTPLYKRKGERHDIRNYRPISILSATAKLIEKIVYEKVMFFLEENNKIMDQQHGYRENRSTQSAVILLTDYIKQNLDNNKVTGAVFIDFVQAFDKVQQEILMSKLYKYGIRGKVLKWFKSYFTNRKLIVTKNSKRSNPYNVIQGTPQGSSLSGLTFTLYLNDIPEILQHSKCIFYADDLVLLVQGNNIEEIQCKLQEDLQLLQNWCKTNKMEINISKTKAMQFQRFKDNTRLCVKLNRTTIESVHEFKYLGLTLNEKLTFDNHYEKVCKTMTSRTYMLNRYKKYFTFKWRHIFVTSLILSLLDYCLPVWGNLKQTKLSRINRIILRSAKLVVLGKNKIKSKLDTIEQLNWLLCEERLERYTLNFIFKNVCGETSLTDSLNGFIRNEQKRSSKFQNNFIVPRMKTEYGKSTFTYRGILLWNKLPSSIKELESFHHFDRGVTMHILSQRENDMIYF